MTANPFIYVGGLIGVTFIVVAASVVHSLGVLLFALLSILGQMGGALVLDAVVRDPGQPFNVLLVLGVVITGERSPWRRRPRGRSPRTNFRSPTTDPLGRVAGARGILAVVTATIPDGKAVAAQIKNELRTRVDALRGSGIVPGSAPSSSGMTLGATRTSRASIAIATR